ncbi:FliH/SctL family protein [Thiospirillum jenense]|uniref:Flagellar assembly protein FliH n=1 Tax=Thiospirillum jenense TaxID=1653858 RepID=A0A839HN26_9GAMM|nr:flagellar assembly protein FliH [Thiospirillum jenense]
MSSVLLAEQAAGVARWQPPYFGPLVIPEPEAEEAQPEPVVEPEPPEPTFPPLTAEELDAIKTEGYNLGYHDGFTRGYQDGRNQGYQEIVAEVRAHAEQVLQTQVQALENVARALVDPLADAAEALEPELLLLVTTLAEQVIQSELTTRPTLIQSVLQQALDRLPVRGRTVRVRLHPDDHLVLSTYAVDLPDTFVWLPDEDITRGGCSIESSASRIDARLTTRLQQAVAAIWGDMTTPPPPVVETAPVTQPVDDTQNLTAEISGDTGASAGDEIPTVEPVAPPPRMSDPAAGELL